jgi:hypothetical protein
LDLGEKMADPVEKFHFGQGFTPFFWEKGYLEEKIQKGFEETIHPFL